jgi:hypothetical protein
MNVLSFDWECYNGIEDLQRRFTILKKVYLLFFDAMKTGDN